MYTSHLIANTGPVWKKEAENAKVDTVVTRSWDNMFYRVECKGHKMHSIFKGKFFAIVVADQHHPAMLPAVDGVCICVIRHQDLSVAQILTHTAWMIADAASKEVKPRLSDEHGAYSVIQMAIDKGREVHLFICSGSGLISDQPSGTSFQMQRGLI